MQKRKRDTQFARERINRELERIEKSWWRERRRLKRKLRKRLRKRLAPARPEIQRRVQAMLAFMGIKEANNKDPAGITPRGRTFLPLNLT